MTVHERVNRRRFRRVIKIILIGAISFAVVGLVYGFFFSRFLKIETVEVSGAETLNADAVSAFVEEAISGKYVGIFPRNHRFLLNEVFLSAALKERFMRIAEVSFRYRLGEHTLTVLIRERKPVAYWCKTAEDTNREDACFLVDVQGVLYEPALFPHTPNGILKISDEANRALRTGLRIADRDYMLKMINLREGVLPEVIISEFIVEEESIPAHYVKARTQKGWFVYFDTSEDAEKTIQALKTVLAKEINEKQNRLEYIDLRVPGRAYYKLR